MIIASGFCPRYVADTGMFQNCGAYEQGLGSLHGRGETMGSQKVERYTLGTASTQ